MKKFRAWDKFCEKYCTNLPDIYIVKRDNGLSFYLDEIGDRKYDIEQYTGVEDKKGKEIYDGDIILDDRDNSVNKVEWLALDSQFAKRNIITKIYCGLYRDSSNHYEVIGNIHENPELLEG